MQYLVDLQQTKRPMPKQELLSTLKNIKDDIAMANVEEAIKALLHFVRNDYPHTDYEQEIILLSQQFHTILKQERTRTINSANFVEQKNRITKALLDIIQVLQENITPLVTQTSLSQQTESLPNPPQASSNESKPKLKVDDLVAFVHPPKPKIVLKASNIVKTYGRFSNFKLSVEELELKLGTITALVGENAVGKTTLLRILAGELAQTKGCLEYPLFQNNKRLNWRKIKQQIAYIPQHLPAWQGNLYQNLCYAAVTHGIKPKEAEEEVNYIVHRLGLVEHLAKSWRELSGGYKLRYALAKALVWHPTLLLIDEPLAHLDIRAQLVVLNDLKEIATSGRYPIAILLSSQHIHEVEYIADNVLFMQNGQLNKTPKDAVIEYHHFELNCSLSKQELKKRLENSPIPCHKVQYTGMSYILTTANTISTLQLQQWFIEQDISLSFFRDISQSVKTKFYEKK